MSWYFTEELPQLITSTFKPSLPEMKAAGERPPAEYE